jgi:small GTP-binding protein
MSTTVKQIKLIVVGDGAVGKTCLLTRYCKGKFPEAYIPTVFDNDVVSLYAGNRLIELELYDTAGQEEYDRLRPLSYANADIFLVCFSVVNWNSYQNVKNKWHPELCHFSPEVPQLLVGTKIDLRKENTKEGKTILTTEKGQQLASEIKALGYWECSAKTGEGLKQIFEEAVRLVLQRESQNK